MAYITIVKRGYKPTYRKGAPASYFKLIIQVAAPLTIQMCEPGRGDPQEIFDDGNSGEVGRSGHVIAMQDLWEMMGYHLGRSWEIPPFTRYVSSIMIMMLGFHDFIRVFGAYRQCKNRDTLTYHEDGQCIYM